MKNKLIALAVAGAASSPMFAAAAEPASPHSFTANVSMVSDYVFRGISQTNHKPAIQGGFDYSHSSGFYAGTWASNVDWVTTKDDNSMEWDFYAGYSGSINDDWSFDVGGLYYYYPGNKIAGNISPDSLEAYGSVSWKFVTLKYSHALSSHLFAWGGYDMGTSTFNNNKNRGSGYLDLSAEYELGDGWAIQGHIGHQKIKNNKAASYTDWKIGVTKDVGVGVVGLTYTDTNARGCGDTHVMYCWGANGNVDVGDGRAVLSFSKSF